MKAILRIAVAIIFIASGFVKSVDPVGFSFKLEEYFSPGVFNLPFLEKFALAFAITISYLEVILGCMLLLKIKLKKCLIALISLCVFFGFLTFYSAYFNVVTDCGCFGDALKLTPWQSFWKDIVLLIALLILWKAYQKHETNNSPYKKHKRLAFLVLGFLVLYVIFHGIKHEPLIDFRAYKINTSLINEKKKIAENPSIYKTFYVLKNNKTGEERKVNQDDYVNDKSYWQEGTPWEILTDKSVSEITHKGYESEISKFRLEDSQGNDITESVLNTEKAVLVFSYNPKNISTEVLAKAEKTVKGNHLYYGISPYPDTFKGIPNAVLDGTAIKTIARSNPFILVLKKGVIVDKRSLEDFENK